MITRLKTTSEIENKLIELDRRIKLSSKAAIMRIALSYSIKQKEDPRVQGGVIRNYDLKKQDGVDYQRLTIFGQNEELFRLLMINHLGREIGEEEFFPELTFYHIERGINLLYSEYLYINDKDKFFEKLSKLN